MLEKNPILLSLAILILATLAVFTPELALLFVAGITAIIAVYRYPVFGISLALLATVFGEYGRFTLIGISLLPLDIIAPLVLSVFIIRKLIEKGSFALDRSSLLLLVFWGAAGLSLLFGSFELAGSETKFAALHLLRFITISGLFFVARDLPSKKNFQAGSALFLTGIILAGLGFWLMTQIPNFTDAGLTEEGWDPHIGRLTSTWLDPNFAAGAFAFILAYAGAEFLSSKKVLKQISLLGIAGVLLVALLLTYSRSGLLALGVAGLVLGLVKSRQLLIGLIVVAAIGMFISPRLAERVGELAQSASSLTGNSQQVLDPTAQLRVSSWKEGWRIWEQSPLLGTGYGAYKFHQNFSDEDSHAATGSDFSLLNVAATTGVLGLMAYLALLSSLFLDAWKNRKTALGLGFLAAGAGLLVHSVFVNSLFYPPLMLYFFVLAGMVQNTGIQDKKRVLGFGK